MYRGKKRHDCLLKDIGPKMWNFTGRAAVIPDLSDIKDMLAMIDVLDMLDMMDMVDMLCCEWPIVLDTKMMIYAVLLKKNPSFPHLYPSNTIFFRFLKLDGLAFSFAKEKPAYLRH